MEVFSKTHTPSPILHQPNNLKIELEEGTSPPFGPIYSLSQSELKSLQEFLDEHLAKDFICLSHSLGRALVLFRCKKDGSLYICVNFCGLNKITKKDCYPLFVRYQSPMNLRQVYSTLPSSTIPFPFPIPSYFCHISDTPPFISVPLVPSFIPMFPVSLISIPCHHDPLIPCI